MKAAIVGSGGREHALAWKIGSSDLHHLELIDMHLMLVQENLGLQVMQVLVLCV